MYPETEALTQNRYNSTYSEAWEFKEFDLGVIIPWLLQHDFIPTVRQRWGTENQAVVQVYRRDALQADNRGGYESSLYNRYDVDAFAIRYGLPAVDYSVLEAQALDVLLAEANTPQVTPHQLILPDDIARLLPQMRQDADGNSRSITIHYCCKMEGGHYNVAVKPLRSDVDSAFYVTTLESLEQALRPPMQRIEVVGEYDPYNDYYTFPFEDDFVRHTANGEVGTKFAGARTWTLEEVRECHGRVNDEEGNRYFILNPPTDLFNHAE